MSTNTSLLLAGKASQAKSIKTYIDNLIANYKKDGFKSFGEIKKLIETIVKKVEEFSEANKPDGLKISEQKKQLAKDILFVTIDAVPIPIKLYFIPLPQFVIKQAIKQVAGLLIDKIVAYLNKTGEFKKSAT